MQGRVNVPGSKSIANRALVCAALADGESAIVGAPTGDDTHAMIDGLRALGAGIAQQGATLVITGGIRFGSGDCVLDVHASGTTMRFLTAVAALTGRSVTLDGVARMRERPIGPLGAALRTLGVEVTYPGDGGYPPLTIRGPIRGTIVAIDASLSSQFVTALMLIGPMLPEGLTLRLQGETASLPYLRTTSEVMAAFGATATLTAGSALVAPGGYRATHYMVEPDASSAVYPWVGAAMTGGEVVVERLPAASTQADMGVLAVLERMGATIGHDPELVVRGAPGGLRGVDADLSGCPDGALALAVAASGAKGKSRFTGLATLRVKETDRLEALRAELTKVGADVTVHADSIEITPRPLAGAEIQTYDDHRMAMSFALLGLTTPGVLILDPGCVAKTWPSFWEAFDAMTRPPNLAVIAIDGPAGTGKTTVASAVAEALGGTRLDTGAFYRAATLLALRSAIDPSDGAAIADRLTEAALDYSGGVMHLDGEDVSEGIRSPAVNAAVSVVAAHPEVRSQLVAHQRRWIDHEDGVVVVEGRDIGTVVFPDAGLKVYLDAMPEVRAARRAGEVGTNAVEELDRLLSRDEIDSTRDASPLRAADDAWILDTSALSVDEVVRAIVERHRSSTAGG